MVKFHTMKREILIITVAVLITILVVSYGVYIWRQPIEKVPKNPIEIFNASMIIDGK